VPPGAFRPPPKVDSAIVRLTPLPSEAIPYRDARVFGEVVARAFGQRRKTLRNTSRACRRRPVRRTRHRSDPARRTLSVAEFARLANRLS